MGLGRFRGAGSLGALVLCVGLLIPGTSASAKAIPDRYIVILKDSVASPGTVANDQARKYGLSTSHVYQHALKGYAAKIPAARVTAVERDPRVAYVTADREIFPAACPRPAGSLPTQCIPTGIDRVDADLSSTDSGNGSGDVNVNVAVIDSGIDASHPDLNVAGGVNCGTGKIQPTTDTEGHGTFVAGVIGAKDNGVGVVGVAPGARLWAIRVFGSRSGSGGVGSLVCGIDYVTSTRTDSDPMNDIAVANMSLTQFGADHGGCGAPPDVLHKAICNSAAAGVTYVAAAGNDAEDLRRSRPATYDEVLAATAVSDYDGQPGGLAPICDFREAGETDDTAGTFSNFATASADSAHTIAAPGSCILSTVPLGLSPFQGYAINSGTSFAAPHIAGTIALCVSTAECAGLTPAQIIDKMVADAAAYNAANPTYGFLGDPLHSPDPERYYGYLIRAGGY